MEKEYIKKINNKKMLMVNNKPFIMIAGEVHNSSASSVEYMLPIWEKAQELNLNSLLIPVSWELIEPVEDQFDFTIVDEIIVQARKYQMKIGLLWFGSWKNGQCYYAPNWVKEDISRFHRAQMIQGKNGITLERMNNMTYSTLSAFCEENVKADSKAFGKLMKHLCEFDSIEQTVIIVQVENEPGLLGGAREHSEVANNLFLEPVNHELIEYLKNNYENLTDELKRNFNRNKTDLMNWSEAFGHLGQEVFTSYYVAKYINRVAYAGKQEYNLPLVVNCWLDKGQEAGKYPTGGPVSKMMDIYHFVAKDIDIIAPDIYVPNFYDTCDQYIINDNPMFIAECASHSYALSRQIHLIGQYNTLCYSPFGIEDLGNPFTTMEGILFGMDVNDKALSTPQDPIIYGKANKILNELMPIITSNYGTNHLQSATFELGNHVKLDFEKYTINVDFKSRFLKGEFGSCLLVEINENEFYALVHHCQLSVKSIRLERPNVDYLWVEEGQFVDGQWQRRRRLNGDEITTMCFNDVMLLKIKLMTYK